MFVFIGVSFYSTSFMVDDVTHAHLGSGNRLEMTLYLKIFIIPQQWDTTLSHYFQIISQYFENVSHYF